MASQPEISVIMPVWNGARHLREAIESVLNQTETNFELVIIDDGSTDTTTAIVETVSWQRPLLIYRTCAGGRKRRWVGAPPPNAWCVAGL